MLDDMPDWMVSPDHGPALSFEPSTRARCASSVRAKSKAESTAFLVRIEATGWDGRNMGTNPAELPVPN